MVNARKQLTRLIILLVPVFFLSLNSCSKELVVNLEGEWVVFPPNVFIGLTYNPNISGSDASLDGQTLLDLITASLEEASKELAKLERIVFRRAISPSEENIVEFYYHGTEEPVLGTYEQNNVGFIIKNEDFPDGIEGLSNNHELEIYYPRDYVQEILHEIVGIDADTINDFITKLSGLGFYIRK